ncbi:MAG: purine-nucleoside phosphorylase [Gammaproteobacteria bacterium]|nr:purine-nucleoside phosphorylase [Gammaproteobacteria bacterium]NNF60431.1 purine-nucleoside phosphorylase [Gammaproteobacteria bacterium]NNM20641.1 purine-nucleoside phosphorylase [Gammaproteobacteria bacterium]
MATKHMNAARGDFAESVLMPGDPLRARYIAESYLDDARQVTDVRNMLGFTGSFQGVPVSVMAHGMGIPSVSIYATELMTEYDVRRIIRVGSCGTVNAATKLRDIIIGMGACTDSGVNRMRFGGYDYACIASYKLLRKAVEIAARHGAPYQVGNLFSADLFYTPDTAMFDIMERFNILGLEMEAAGLYALGAEHNVDTLAICTVSDNIRTGAALTADERASTFDDMIKIALETVKRSV